MSVNTIAARLARIQGNITGVTSAFDLDEIPNALRSGHLPAFINVPGEAESAQETNYGAERRTWHMLLYLSPVERPFGIAQRMNVAAPFFERVRVAFAARDGLESLDNLLSSSFRGDSGVTAPLEYGGQLYTGIEFRLETVEMYDIDRVDYA